MLTSGVNMYNISNVVIINFTKRFIYFLKITLKYSDTLLTSGIVSLNHLYNNFQLDVGPLIDAMINEFLQSDSGGPTECTRLFIMDFANSSTLIPQSENHAAELHLPEDQPALLATKLANQRLEKVVYQQVRCLTTILGTDIYNMKDLATLSKPMYHNILFKLGGEKPSGNDLKMLDRPMVWIEEAPLVSFFNYPIA